MASASSSGKIPHAPSVFLSEEKTREAFEANLAFIKKQALEEVVAAQPVAQAQVEQVVTEQAQATQTQATQAQAEQVVSEQTQPVEEGGISYEYSAPDFNESARSRDYGEMAMGELIETIVEDSKTQGTVTMPLRRTGYHSCTNISLVNGDTATSPEFAEAVELHPAVDEPERETPAPPDPVASGITATIYTDESTNTAADAATARDYATMSLEELVNTIIADSKAQGTVTMPLRREGYHTCSNVIFTDQKSTNAA